jgi:hypothetical protein
MPHPCMESSGLRAHRRSGVAVPKVNSAPRPLPGGIVGWQWSQAAQCPGYSRTCAVWVGVIAGHGVVPGGAGKHAFRLDLHAAQVA